MGSEVVSSMDLGLVVVGEDAMDCLQVMNSSGMAHPDWLGVDRLRIGFHLGKPAAAGSASDAPPSFS